MAKLARLGVVFYGLRVVEPHHDSTPHWHMLLFLSSCDRPAVESVLFEYALKEDGRERGAFQSRVEIQLIDREKGTGTGYIAKYVAKNIDGKDVGEDLYGHDAISSALRIRAWASNWNIRQFQFFGGPSVTVWRELRRAQREESAKKAIAVIGDELLSDLLEAADNGDWETFMRLCGGPSTKLADQPLRAFHVKRDRPNKYGEETRRILGLIYQGVNRIVTRVRKWEIRPRDFLRADEIGKVCFSSGGANAPPLEFCQ